MSPSLLVALAVAAHAAAPDTPIEVKGVGNVRLEHAEQTCLADVPQGEVTVAKDNHRIAAFQDIARGLLGQPAEVRKEYFRYHNDLDWPTQEIDVAYVPGVTWVPPGVVGACEAAGAFWVREGIRLATLCADDKAGCKTTFGEADWEIVKEAVKLAKKDTSVGKDPFFAYLNDHDAELENWSNPLPYLDKACSWPQTASGQSRFIDRDDLVAARRACLQVQILVTHASAIPPVDQPCATAWRDVSADAAFLVAAPNTDLGATSDYPDEQVESLRDRLSRMDPSPAKCPGDWAATWRKQLVRTWREAQTSQACADTAMALPDRLHLCPTLPATTTEACDGGDSAACHLLAGLYAGGLGVATDEVKAIELYLKACGAGSSPSCDELGRRITTITTWVNERLTAATPITPELPPDAPKPKTPPPPPPVPDGAHARLDEVRTILASYGKHLDPKWAPLQAQRLFQIAIAARYVDLAGAVLTEYTEALGPEWVTTSTEQLEALKTALAAAPSN